MSSSAIPPAVAGGSRAPAAVHVHTYPAQLQYPPRTYFLFSLLVTIFAFWPTGLVALISAARVNTLWRAGEHNKARKASRRARNWGLTTLAIGVAIALVVGVGTVLYLNM